MLAYFNHPTGQAGDNSMAGQDADGDGMSNLQEFLTGTDPLYVNSAFRITTMNIVDPDVQISWTTVAGKTNQLQRALSLDGGGSWSNIGSSTAGTGNIVTQPDIGAATNAPPQFYRVRLVP